MPPLPDDPLQSPQDSDAESQVSNPRIRKSTRPYSTPLASVASLSYRRSNASLSHLFQSTTSVPTLASTSGNNSGTVTPTAGTINGSVFSPGGSTRAGSPAPTSTSNSYSGATRDLILKAFAPHVSVLASADAEELIRHKGLHGGLLELLRPFGEHVQGKVTIRDSSGASLSWDDYAIRFMGVKDGLESPRLNNRTSIDSVESPRSNGHNRLSSLDFQPARLRSGGDVAQIEELVERHLTFAEEHSGPIDADYLSHNSTKSDNNSDSPFYLLYLRRLLSGMPMVPSESLSHPVATIIAISSRCKSPIEELRNLFTASNAGEHRLPPWVLNEFLRYYILIHDEDYDDIQKSMALFDQMKRHFGLHCHLLRLRSTQCVSSDDESMKLPTCEWKSAAEELAGIVRREIVDDDDGGDIDDTPYIFESDATAIRTFVREMVTQSIVPSMERASATWNDQVASKRRGISGRFMSLSKRITTFGGRAASPAGIAGAGSNYDSQQGFYRPDAPEAIMRRLGDYSLMLRDFKLAQSTFEILCQDYKSDKAWRYYAGSNEMAAISALLAMGSGLSTKIRTEAIDQYLETAHYSYITRVGSPYHALRALLLGVELLKPRNGSALDDAARWLSKVLEDRLVGTIGHALLLERIAICYTDRKGSVNNLYSGKRRRKAAFWHALAGESWLRQEKTSQAERCVSEAVRLYNAEQEGNGGRGFQSIQLFLYRLQAAIKANRAGPKPFDGSLAFESEEVAAPEVEPLQDDRAQTSAHTQIHPTHSRNKSLSVSLPQNVDGRTSFDPLGATTGIDNNLMVPHAIVEREMRDDGFE